MKTPALAIGWTIWRRHRWALSGAAVAVIAAIVGSAVCRAVLDAPEALQACGIAIIPLATVAFYLAGVFAYGFETDVASAGTSFPVRMFTLPVRTLALAGWPVAFGAGSVGLLWLACAALILRPAGLDVPLWWPALAAAAQIAWVQALAWWPFGLAWGRLVAGMFIAHLPLTGTMVALKFDVPEPYVIVYLIASLALGVAGAWLGVARSRRGDVPQWLWLSPPWRAARAYRARPAFPSAGRALAWFEWRKSGLVLPLLVGFLTPLCLLPLFLEEHTPGILVRTLGLTFIVPVFFAGMANSTVGKNNPWVREFYGLSSFAGTRPVSTIAMVAARLRAAAKCTLVTWAVVAVTTTAAFVLSGAHRVLAGMFDDWLTARPAAEVAGALAAGVALFVLVTWKRVVENMVIGLTGREWVIKANVLVGLFVAFGVLSFSLWLLIRPEHHGTFRRVMPVLMGLAVGLKFVFAGLAIRGIRRRRLLPDRTLLALGAAWVAIVATLSGLLVWVVPAEIAPASTVVFAVILATPLARLSAMPLALDWNRHR